jgi:hypothetical protein
MKVPLSTRLEGRLDWDGQGTSACVGRLDRQRRVHGEYLVRTDESSEKYGHDVHL